MITALACLLLVALGGSELDLPILPPTDSRREKYEKPKPLPLPTPTVTVVEEEPNPPVFFGETIYTTESIVYVLDFSQSMSSVYEKQGIQWLNRWKVAKRETLRSIAGLAPSIRFGIVVFGTNRGCGVTQWKQDLVPATVIEKAAAVAWLSNFVDVIYYGGATPTAPGVLVGLNMKPDVTVLLTDGEPSQCGVGLGQPPYITHRDKIRNSNEDLIPINVFGIGLPSAEARTFCQAVASDSTGTFVELR